MFLGFGDYAIIVYFMGDSICTFGYQVYFLGIGVSASPESVVDFTVEQSF
jgi:hypothetical protein